MMTTTLGPRSIPIRAVVRAALGGMFVEERRRVRDPGINGDGNVTESPERELNSRSHIWVGPHWYSKAMSGPYFGGHAYGG